MRRQNTSIFPRPHDKLHDGGFQIAVIRVSPLSPAMRSMGNGTLLGESDSWRVLVHSGLIGGASLLRDRASLRDFVHGVSVIPLHYHVIVARGDLNFRFSHHRPTKEMMKNTRLQ